jgi:hypothetical protein
MKSPDVERRKPSPNIAANKTSDWRSVRRADTTISRLRTLTATTM